MLYLSYSNAMIMPIAIESCNKLCLASCCKDSDYFFMIVVLVFDSLMKYISFWLCQSCIDLTPTVPKWTHQPHQKLLKNQSQHLVKHVRLFVASTHINISKHKCVWCLTRVSDWYQHDTNTCDYVNLFIFKVIISINVLMSCLCLYIFVLVLRRYHLPDEDDLWYS